MLAFQPVRRATRPFHQREGVPGPRLDQEQEVPVLPDALAPDMQEGERFADRVAGHLL